MFTSFAFPLEGFRFLYIWGSKLQSAQYLRSFVCNITFVILTIFDFTILFGEEKFSWLPSINKMTYENWRVTLFSTLKKISWITFKLWLIQFQFTLIFLKIFWVSTFWNSRLNLEPQFQAVKSSNSQLAKKCKISAIESKAKKIKCSVRNSSMIFALKGSYNRYMDREFVEFWFKQKFYKKAKTSSASNCNVHLLIDSEKLWW